MSRGSSVRFDPGLIIRTAIIAGFFLFRGIPMPWEGYASSYSIATVGFGAGLLFLGGARISSQLVARHGRIELPFYFPLLCLLTILFTVAFFGASLFGSTKLAQPVFLNFVASTALIYLIFVNFRTLQEIRWVFRGIIIAGIATSIYFFWILYVRALSIFMRMGALGATGATYNTVGYTLAVAFWVSFGATIAIGKKRWIFYDLFVVSPTMLMLVAAIVLTGTKGGVLVLACLCILTYIIGRTRRRQIASIITSIIWLSILIVFATLTLVLAVGGAESTQRMSGLFDSEYILYARVDMWLYAVSKIFQDYWTPLVGIGLGQFSYPMGRYVETYPHNLFLDIAFDAGIPAAVVMGMLLWQAWKSLFGIIQSEEASTELQFVTTQLLGLGMVALVAGLISFKFTDNIMLWVFLGLAARLKLINQRRCSAVVPGHVEMERVSPPDTLITNAD